MVYGIPDVFLFVREHLRNVCYLCVATDATCAKVERVRREKENGGRRRVGGVVEVAIGAVSEPE